MINWITKALRYPLSPPNQVNPLDLLTANRFDVMAKYIFAKYREKEIHSEWHIHLYLEHLKVWNNFSEKNRYGGQKKRTAEQFLNSFDTLLDSIKKHGFNQELSKLWVDSKGNLINGSHRLAACLLYDHKPSVEIRPPNQGQIDCSAEYFRSKKNFIKTGLSSSSLDTMALYYARLKPTAFIATLFPVIAGKDKRARSILKKYGSTVYEKSIQLNKNGAINYIKILYEGEKWLGTWKDNFKGVIGKVEPCFPNNKPLTAILFECADIQTVKKAKEEIRNFYNIGNHSVHISDTHEETLRTAEAVFNENSIHFLNNSRLSFDQARFLRLLPTLRKKIRKLQQNPEDICITASAVLAAYGMRDCRDFDYLHREGLDMPVLDKDIQNHTSESRYYPDNPDEIIYNPKNHFYHKGIKFASLEMMRRFKTKRKEDKDLRDLKLINEIR